MLPKLFASTVACAGPEVQLIGPAPRKSARPVTRRQGMIRMSAVTLAISAASVVGSVAIAVSLPEVSVVTATQSTTAAVSPVSAAQTSGSTEGQPVLLTVAGP